MNVKKIVFPTDFSSLSDAALAHATALARESQARLLIVHVQEPPLAYAGGEMYYGVPEPDTAEITRMLEAVVPTSSDVPYEHHLLTGDPAEGIVRLAAEQNADLIVMGTHGRTGLRRLLMGSVAEAVVRKAPCPVLTFKATEGAPAKA
jgi:nucleotide-binding universal stress UspA family protein